MDAHINHTTTRNNHPALPPTSTALLCFMYTISPPPFSFPSNCNLLSLIICDMITRSLLAGRPHLLSPFNYPALDHTANRASYESRGVVPLASDERAVTIKVSLNASTLNVCGRPVGNPKALAIESRAP